MVKVSHLEIISKEDNADVKIALFYTLLDYSFLYCAIQCRKITH